MPAPLAGRLSDLRVPLSATIPSGISPLILLHWIRRPNPPSPSTSHTTSMGLPTLYPSALGRIMICGLFGFAVTLSTTVRSTHCLLPLELHWYLPESSTLTLRSRRAFLVIWWRRGSSPPTRSQTRSGPSGNLHGRSTVAPPTALIHNHRGCCCCTEASSVLSLTDIAACIRHSDAPELQNRPLLAHSPRHLLAVLPAPDNVCRSSGNNLAGDAWRVTRPHRLLLRLQPDLKCLSNDQVCHKLEDSGAARVKAFTDVIASILPG